MTIDQSSVRNRMLRLLPSRSFAAIAADLERIDAPRGMPLFKPGETISHAYFFERGMGSLVAVSPEGQRVETGLFGREGFGPVALAMGLDRSPFEALVQMPGAAYRMASRPLLDAIQRDADLRGLLLKFAQILTMQAGYTALSNAVHSIDERLARWLLMSHDRADSDELPLTHEFLSIMLAVRRPSVTTALHVLEGNRFIRAERGNITVRNRAALEEFAGDAYGAPEREYQRLIGPL